MIILVVEVLSIIILVMMLSTVITDERKNRLRELRPVLLNGYWDGNERRIIDRLNVSLGVKYYMNGKSSVGKTIDISTKGIRLVLDEKFEKDTPLRFEIKLPDESHIIKARGIVVWSTESQDPPENENKRLFTTGIKFSNFQGNDENVLFDFVHHLGPVR